MFNIKYQETSGAFDPQTVRGKNFIINFKNSA